MIIVAGYLEVVPGQRGGYLNACRDVIERARTTSGCLEFALTPDLLEPGRIQVFERWETDADLEAFRGQAPTGPDASAIVTASVTQYETTAGRPL